MRIGIAGNIGVGKSTLTEHLARHLKAKPHYEQFQGNPYLQDFYRDMESWAFHSQIYFLIQRVKEIQALAGETSDLVLDRTIYEDAEIFARNLYQQGKMAERDFKTYYGLYETVNHLLPAPDLLVYLAAEVPTLLRRIQIRGRESEKQISPEYMEQLNQLYEDWMGKISHRIPVLRIQTDSFELTHVKDRETIFREIESTLKRPEVPIHNAHFQHVPFDETIRTKARAAHGNN
ncbi:MAG: deoxynucleoside kinase [Candidatus Marinimicrobia bacterium]|nr:deoxynucleoside kinase [Candidatus Neomarinimicrobiota bacterium]MCF7839216.1 deoxynucleoside kinase [Candidatus Neomarinimicrobiota bacterium]MCF7902249.1 deoxynucleoside kinase [Candidatus Neomarinimicrobiota bacterium]